MKNINIDCKVLAKHFQDRFTNFRSASETMRISKQRYDEGKKSFWSIYVKAYNWDAVELKGIK